MNKHRIINLTVFFLLVFSYAHADTTRPTIPGQVTSTPPKIDGSLSDECWKSAPSIDKYWMQTDDDAPEKTKTYISYDNKSIYVAFYCYDSDPAQIQAEQHQRRGPMETDDKVIFYIDALNAMQLNQYSRFRVSAGGCMDERIATTQISRSEWHDDWKAAAKRVDDGYIVEIAIPWKMLQYDYKSNHLGVMFTRYLGHTKRNLVSPQVGNNLTPDRWYEWKGLRLPRSVKLPAITTYELMRYRNNYNSEKTGADILYHPSPTSSLEMIVNPDSSSIENYVIHLTPRPQHKVASLANPFFNDDTSDMLGLDMFSTSRSASAYRPDIPSTSGIADSLIESTGWTTAVQFFGRNSGGGGMHSLKYYDRQKSSDFELMQSIGDNGDSAQLVMLEKEFGGKGSISGSMVKSSYRHDNGLSTDINGYYRLYDVGQRRLTAYGYLGHADDGSGKGTGQRVDASMNWEAGIGDWRYWYQYSSADDRFGSTAVPSADAYIEDDDKLISMHQLGKAVPNSDFIRNNAGASIELQPKHSLVEYWTVNIGRDEIQRKSIDESTSRDYSATVEAYLLTGLSLSLEADQTNTPDSDDHTLTYGLGWGNNTLFRNGSISFCDGEVSDGKYQAWEISQGWNIGSNLHSKINWSREQISDPSPDKSIYTRTMVSLVYDFPTINMERSLSGQMAHKGRATNLYIVYRQKSHHGRSFYMMYGDPRAKRTEETFTLKMVQEF